MHTIFRTKKQVQEFFYEYYNYYYKHWLLEIVLIKKNKKWF